MSADVEVLYEQAVLDHGRRPRNRRAIPGAHLAEQHNRMCGDRVTVYVRLEADVVADVSFDGSACAVVMAAASLMTEAVMGHTVRDVEALADRFEQLLVSPGAGPFADLGALSALAGVRQFPLRIRCGLLPWQALRAAIAAHGRRTAEGPAPR